MSDQNGSCALKCWAAAGGLGVLTFLLNVSPSGRGMLAALVLGLLVFGLFGLLFNWLFCKSGTADLSEEKASGAATSTPSAATAAASVTSAGAAAPAPAAQAPAAEDASDDQVEADSDKAEGGDAPAEAEDDTAAAASGDEALVKPSTALAGEEELASRKGEWKYEADQDAGAETGEAAAADTGAEAESAQEAPAAAPAAAPVEGVGVIKPSKPLAGQDDLAARKGSWRYEGGDPAPSSAKEDKVDRDGDGVVEGTDEGTKPAMLDGPREGGADNLKEIKGIGPKLEKLCNSLGVYHFDQIAAWSKDELAWIDANLAGFKGRATRDDWVGQATILASGGETEFSQRVEDGKVY